MCFRWPSLMHGPYLYSKSLCILILINLAFNKTNQKLRKPCPPIFFLYKVVRYPDILSLNVSPDVSLYSNHVSILLTILSLQFLTKPILLFHYSSYRPFQSWCSVVLISLMVFPPMTTTITSSSLVFLVPEDRLFGVQLPNGTWNGIMGLLERQVRHQRDHVNKNSIQNPC